MIGQLNIGYNFEWNIMNLFWLTVNFPLKVTDCINDTDETNATTTNDDDGKIYRRRGGDGNTSGMKYHFTNYI